MLRPALQMLLLLLLHFVCGSSSEPAYTAVQAGLLAAAAALEALPASCALAGGFLSMALALLSQPPPVRLTGSADQWRDMAATQASAAHAVTAQTR